MPRQKLTNEERAFLAKYEPQLKTAVEARWVSHIPEEAIDKMLSIWEDMAGSKRPFRRGCSTCILNLVRDLGIPYFEQKAEETQKTPVSASSPAKCSKGPGKGKTSQKPKNSK